MNERSIAVAALLWANSITLEHWRDV